MHLVIDGGTFFLAVGIGLVAAALNPRRNAIAVVVAAIAGVMHSVSAPILTCGWIALVEASVTEVLGIYVPAIVLIAIAVNPL